MNQDNSNNLDQDESNNSVDQQTSGEQIQPIPVSPDLDVKESLKPHSNKKLYIIIGAILAILLAVSAYFLLRKDNSKTTQANTATSQTTKNKPIDTKKDQEVAKEQVADNVVYSFTESDNKPYSVFWRPASAGQRTLSTTMSNKTRSGYSDVKMGNVAYVSSPDSGATDSLAVYFSKDSGKTFKKIYSLPVNKETSQVGDQITSIKISNDGSKVVVGYLPGDSSNQVTEINPDTLATKKLFTSTKAGVFITAYDSVSEKIIYSEGCFNCDGNIGNTVVVRNLKTGQIKELVKSTDTMIKQSVSVNADFTELLVEGVTKDLNSAVKDSFFGYYMGAPYTVISVNIDSAVEKSIASFGEKQKDPNSPAVHSSIGYMADGKTAYYALDKQVYSLSSGKPTLLYEAPKGLYSVYFVSDASVVAGYGTYNDFVLNNFSTKDKKVTQILSGDNKTSIFGVTTK